MPEGKEKGPSSRGKEFVAMNTHKHRDVGVTDLKMTINHEDPILHRLIGELSNDQVAQKLKELILEMVVSSMKEEDALRLLDYWMVAIRIEYWGHEPSHNRDKAFYAKRDSIASEMLHKMRDLHEELFKKSTQMYLLKPRIRPALLEIAAEMCAFFPIVGGENMCKDFWKYLLTRHVIESDTAEEFTKIVRKAVPSFPPEKKMLELIVGVREIYEQYPSLDSLKEAHLDALSRFLSSHQVRSLGGCQCLRLAGVISPILSADPSALEIVTKVAERFGTLSKDGQELFTELRAPRYPDVRDSKVVCKEDGSLFVTGKVSHTFDPLSTGLTPERREEERRETRRGIQSIVDLWRTKTHSSVKVVLELHDPSATGDEPKIWDMVLLPTDSFK